MTRTHGRAARGQRLVEAVPHGHWKITTYLAAFRQDGLFAPLAIDGGINGELFLGYLRQHLAPALRRGDLVVMDNLSSHQVAGVAEALAAVGAEPLYLPPYSPDLNPIENVFGVLKQRLRKSKPRTLPDLEAALAAAPDWFPPAACARFFRHCGYATLHQL